MDGLILSCAQRYVTMQGYPLRKSLSIAAYLSVSRLCQPKPRLCRRQLNMLLKCCSRAQTLFLLTSLGKSCLQKLSLRRGLPSLICSWRQNEVPRRKTSNRRYTVLKMDHGLWSMLRWSENRRPGIHRLECEGFCPNLFLGYYHNLKDQNELSKASNLKDFVSSWKWNVNVKRWILLFLTNRHSRQVSWWLIYGTTPVLNLLFTCT